MTWCLPQQRRWQAAISPDGPVTVISSRQVRTVTSLSMKVGSTLYWLVSTVM